MRRADVGEQRLVEHRRLDGGLLLADFRCQVALQRADLLDLRVRDVERVEDLGLRDLVRAGLDHQDRVLRARDDEVEVGALEQVLLVGVHDEVAVDLADPHRPDGAREGHVGDHQRRRRAVHREDVVGMYVVDRNRDRDEMRLVVPALREQRTQRTVDHARRQRSLLARAPLALEERAGDLPGGVHALLDVHRQREEVDVALTAGGGGREDHRVALADDYGTGGLLGHPAGLERDLAAGDLHGDPRHGVTAHILSAFPSARPTRPFRLGALGGAVSIYL